MKTGNIAILNNVKTKKFLNFNWIWSVLVVFGALFMLLPFVWMVLTSLKTPAEIQAIPLKFLPDNWLNFQNYIDLFKRQPFHLYVWNTIVVSGISTFTSVIFRLMAGYGLPNLNSLRNFGF